MLKVFLAACVVMPVAASWWAPSRIPDDPGRVFYEDKCSRCHGAEGRGGNAPRLVPFRWSYEQALELVRRPECDMPPIPASEVSDAQVAQIVSYLKTIK